MSGLYLPAKRFKHDADAHKRNARAIEAWAVERVTFLLKTKSADETVTSSTTLQDDDELKFEIGPNEKWLVTFDLIYDAVTAADIKVSVSAPAGASGTMRGLGTVVGVTAANGDGNFATAALGGTLSYGGAGAGTIVGCRVWGVITADDTAGTVKLQWAQDASNATGTILKAGSYLTAHKQAT